MFYRGMVAAIWYNTNSAILHYYYIESGGVPSGALAVMQIIAVAAVGWSPPAVA